MNRDSIAERILQELEASPNGLSFEDLYGGLDVLTTSTSDALEVLSGLVYCGLVERWETFPPAYTLSARGKEGRVRHRLEAQRAEFLSDEERRERPERVVGFVALAALTVLAALAFWCWVTFWCWSTWWRS